LSDDAVNTLKKIIVWISHTQLIPIVINNIE
jgi:hypothetical protein